MEIVDLQLHEPAPFLPWDGESDDIRRRVVMEALLQMMDAVGVDAVVLHPVEDPALADQLAREEPGRFSSVPFILGGRAGRLRRHAIDPEAPDIEERITQTFAEPGVVALRFTANPSFAPEEFAKFQSGGYDRALAACERQGIPVLLMISGAPAAATRVAERYPELQVIVDHIGLKQRPFEQPDDPEWLRLPDVLKLAEYPNIALKLCGAPGLSRERYPFPDVRPYVDKLVAAFGPDRLAWASDIGRFRGRIGWTIRAPDAQGPYPGKHNYMESLAFYLHSNELSDSEKGKILGATTRRLLHWPGPKI